MLGGELMVDIADFGMDMLWVFDPPICPAFIKKEFQKGNILFCAFWQIAGIANDFFHKSSIKVQGVTEKRVLIPHGTDGVFRSKLSIDQYSIE